MALVYGMHDLETRKEMLIQDIGITEMNDRLMMWNDEVNRVFDAIMGTFTQRKAEWNTTPITRIQSPSVARAQFVDEYGVAKPRIEKGYFEQGLPLHRYEDAVAFSYEALRKTTVEQYSRELARIDRADMGAAMFLFWFAIFYNTNWTHTSTEDALPNIPVKAGANNDGDLYVIRGEAAPTAAQHYVGQAGAISDSADPFPTIKDTLTRYAGTSANDRVVTFVGDATNATAIKELSGFHRVDRTQFTRWGDDVSLVDPGADTFLGMGDEVLGEHEEGVLVVRKRDLPSGYLASFNIDAEPAIGIREDATPALQGLFNINSIEDSGNTYLSRWRRKIGFAPVNRTGFMVTEISDASYDIPAAYADIPG
jgi:hypothetical protein